MTNSVFTHPYHTYPQLIWFVRNTCWRFVQITAWTTIFECVFIIFSFHCMEFFIYDKVFESVTNIFSNTIQNVKYHLKYTIFIMKDTFVNLVQTNMAVVGIDDINDFDSKYCIIWGENSNDEHFSQCFMCSFWAYGNCTGLNIHPARHRPWGYDFCFWTFNF